MIEHKTITELDKLAMAIINGEIEPMVIFSLNIFDQWAVRALADVYSMCLLGVQSRKTCIAEKRAILHQYEYYKTRISSLEALNLKHIETVTTTSSESCNITKALQKGDLLSALKSALICLDAYQSGNVYMKAFERAVSDPDFKSKALKASQQQIDELMSLYGNDVPYARMIERLFAVADKDRLTKLFAQLDPEKFSAMAEEMPYKTEDEKSIKIISNSIKALYGVKAA